MSTMWHQSSLSANLSDNASFADREDSVIRADRAGTDLRRGRPVVLWGNTDAYIMASVENGHDNTAASVTALAGNEARVVITAQRAQALGFVNGNARPQSLKVPSGSGPATTWTQQVSCAPLQGPEARELLAGADARPAPADVVQAIDLAKACHLVPALVVAPIAAEQVLTVERLLASGRLLGVGCGDIERLPLNNALTLARVSEARVPLVESTETRFIVFRSADGATEQIAIQIGTPDGETAPMVRLHSACLTGDLFGSLRCDCGEQLRGAVRTIADNGWGLILYLAQEGRGIGLANKMRTYDLQDKGLDTIDSDRLLGYGADERRYEIAVAMLRALDVDRVRVMTNNPEKIAHLTAGGIEIVDRVALQSTVNEHNYRYLNAKITRAGHMLDDSAF